MSPSVGRCEGMYDRHRLMRSRHSDRQTRNSDTTTTTTNDKFNLP